MVDMPSPDRRFFGRGLSSLERSIAVSNAQILLGRHQNELLNNQPPTGMVTISGIAPTQYDDAKQQFEYDRIADGNNLFRGLMELKAIEPGQEIKVNFIPFSQLPEGFSYDSFMQTHVNMLALATGQDPQDIWPLASTALGSGQQSKFLDAKGRAKAFGSSLTRLERLFNSIIDKRLEFKFKPNDTESEKSEAEHAKVWAEVGAMMRANGASEQQVMQLMANNVSAFADVLLDSAGQLRLQDDDPKDESSSEDDNITTATDETPPSVSDGSPDATEQVTTAADNTPPDGSGLELQRGRLYLHRKDYAKTRDQFIADFSELVQVGLEGEDSARTFASQARAILYSSGRKAYLDGLRAGGVETDELDTEDKDVLAVWLADNGDFIKSFAARATNGTTQMTPEARAQAWANKSLQRAYDLGLLASDTNGMYEWLLGATEEHCSDCIRLAGQKHRYKEWYRAGWLPKSDKLECNGFNCDCNLRKTTGRVRGRF